MEDSVYLHMKRARDGGLSITEISANNETELVFAGNVKDATDYFGKRATDLASNPVPKSDTLDDRIVSYEPRRDTERRAALNPRVIADRLASLDQDATA